jgi:hypothetical protein
MRSNTNSILELVAFAMIVETRGEFAPNLNKRILMTKEPRGRGFSVVTNWKVI